MNERQLGTKGREKLSLPFPDAFVVSAVFNPQESSLKLLSHCVKI